MKTDGLTAREQQVADLVSQGLRNQDVAATLNLCESTVEQYLVRVYDKVGVDNRVQLARVHHKSN